MLGKSIHITDATLEHCAGINNIVTHVWGETYSEITLASHIERFSESVFVALHHRKVVGFALTMLTNRAPSEKPLTWDHAVGGDQLDNHTPTGEWLYGVDFAIHPDYRRRGIGTRMYRARFNLVKRLNLRGFYAGGMLRGYEKYRHRMTLQEYGDRVIRGEIKDPTVSMQINRGFKPRTVIENYAHCPEANDGAVLIVWSNPQYQIATA
ncbi:MAG: GNAT family N-acetyltransferase [Anaerolineae bacterium]|nr:GNAT family N-acetyltransferase [Anaerolineae bacterium]